MLKTIMVLSDNLTELCLYKKLLNKCQLLDDVIFFTDPAKALKEAETKKIVIGIISIQKRNLDTINLINYFVHNGTFIATSSKEENALDAYNLGAVDFLFKQPTTERINKAISKAKLLQAYYNKINTSIASNNQTSNPIQLQVGYSKVFIQPNNIIYIQSNLDYAEVHTTKDKITALVTLKELNNKLDQSQFIRVHRSFIVNKNCIAQTYNDRLILLNEIQIPISRSYKTNFKTLLSIHKN